MSVFTPEQEARLREIVREEALTERVAREARNQEILMALSASSEGTIARMSERVA